MPSKVPDQRADASERARPEDDAAGSGEFKSHGGLSGGAKSRRVKAEPARSCSWTGYQPSSAGKTLANFTLERGSAIMGATVSRHAA